MTRIVLLLLLLWIPCMRAQSAPLPSIVHASADRVHRGGEAYFEVNASGFVHATPEQAWRVLTDYDRLAEFVPDLLSSRLISRKGSQAVVEQRSEASFLFVTHPIHIVVRLSEQPFSSIDVALISGNMKRYSAHWQLAPSVRDGVHGTRIIYSGAMEPDFFIPPVVGESIEQSSMKKMVEAEIREIEHRH